ncbi:MAG: phospholipase D-like domain-containing protein [Candidatus Woesearchaeota archaeon]
MKKLIKLTLILFSILFLSLIYNSNSFNNKKKITLDNNITINHMLCPMDDCYYYLKNLNYTNGLCFLYNIDDFGYNLLTDNRTKNIIIYEYYKNKRLNETISLNTDHLMHLKICFFDNITITGSLNPTESGFFSQTNDILSIESHELKNKLKKSLLNSVKKCKTSNNKDISTNCLKKNLPIVKSSDESFIMKFNNFEEQLISEFSNKDTLSFILFYFNLDRLFKNIIDKLDIGILNKNSDHLILDEINQTTLKKLDIIDKIMIHNKLFFSKNLTITGSYNPTNNGKLRNLENIVILKNHYQKNFEKLDQYSNFIKELDFTFRESDITLKKEDTLISELLFDCPKKNNPINKNYCKEYIRIDSSDDITGYRILIYYQFRGENYSRNILINSNKFHTDQLVKRDAFLVLLDRSYNIVDYMNYYSYESEKIIKREIIDNKLIRSYKEI